MGWREDRDIERTSRYVCFWEDSDVSDIDCTPAYKSDDLSERIRRVQQLAPVAKELTENNATAAVEQPASKEEEVWQIHREPHHIDVIGIAKRLCLQADVPFKSWARKYLTAKDDDSNVDSAIESRLLLGVGDRYRRSRRFDAQLMPGEGEAMAAYVASGQRIPRRGEIGWTPDEIDRFERSGYVMSGSRNKRITNMRLKKEAEVYSAEQQRALLLYTFEQRQQREKQVAEELKSLLRKATCLFQV